MSNELIKIGTTTFYKNDLKSCQPLMDDNGKKWHVVLKDGTSLFVNEESGGEIHFGQNLNGKKALRFSGVKGMSVFTQGSPFDVSGCDGYNINIKDGKVGSVNVHQQIGSAKSGQIIKDQNDSVSHDNDVYELWEHAEYNPKNEIDLLPDADKEFMEKFMKGEISSKDTRAN